MKTYKVSFIIPCFNEEGNVKNIYKNLLETFKGESIQLIFINDGSNDETFNEITNIYNKSKDVVGINFSRNFGKESAILAGLKKAEGKYTTIIDADMQQDPKIAKKMIEILDNNENIDCVCAKQVNREESKTNIFFKKLFYYFVNKLSEVQLEENASDFRTFRTNVKDALLEITEYYRFSKGLFSWVGFNTKYIEYKANKRQIGESKWSISKLFQYGIDGILSFSVFPLKLAIYIGSFVSALSIFYMLYVIIKRIVIGDIPGYATIVVLILFLGGVQLIVLGLIGEYLARVYVQGKKRPIYIEKEVLMNNKNGKH